MSSFDDQPTQIMRPLSTDSPERDPVLVLVVAIVALNLIWAVVIVTVVFAS
jgi:hypothetical protein